MALLCWQVCKKSKSSCNSPYWLQIFSNFLTSLTRLAPYLLHNTSTIDKPDGFLFTNIPVEETINICVDKLIENKTKVNNLFKESFRPLLELATLDSFFIFDGKYYKQKDGVAMCFPLGPTPANLFSCHFEEQWMSDYPIDYKPISYRRYVDDTILFFSSELQINKFLNFMNSKHQNINFTVERKENNPLSFLDLKSFSWH